MDHTQLDYSQEESKLEEIEEELNAGFEGFEELKKQILAREKAEQDIENGYIDSDQKFRNQLLEQENAL